jgi:GTP diphosphokinase / guanosine-3',5'-bis(diphosphate) 3'-diphosphatase
VGVLSFSTLEEVIRGYLPEKQCAVVARAFSVAERSHRGQKRRSGEPYITHPLAVALILAEMRLDKFALCAALLHDTLEDTSLNKKWIESHFGSCVAELVDGVSKLTRISADDFHKMIVAMAKDVRVILIKLADRLHNMRTLTALSREKQERIARETISIYAPLAARLGIQTMRMELEDRSFKALYPWRYQVLTKAIERIRHNRRELFLSLEKDLVLALEAKGIDFLSIRGREKHAYSVYHKMSTKALSLNEVMDMYGFRVIVDSVDTCYRTLGVAHSVFKPVMGRFKDYIALPKSNHYQSLHTTLLGPHGVPLELQIRTESMDHHADSGIAAHWIYKTKQYTSTWGENILEIQDHVGDTTEFMETVKHDLVAEAVYVFTPKGKLLPLPEGSTCVDVAYAIRPDVGHQCVAAKIDRQLVPVSTRVSNGQTIEILVVPQGCPDEAWLNFVVTGKAKTHIRTWLKSKQLSEARALGRSLLVETAHTMDEAMLEEYGLGKHPDDPTAQGPVILSGQEGSIVHYAHCCWPVPGDDVIGTLIKDNGLFVHRKECQKRERFNTVLLEWSPSMTGMYVVPIIVGVLNRRGVLGHMAMAIAEGHADIQQVRADERDERHYTVEFWLKVRDRVHLARVIRRLRALAVVTRITRRST